MTAVDLLDSESSEPPVYKPSLSRRLVGRALHDAGIHIDGNGAHDLRIHDERFFRRVLFEGSLGLGDAYVEGWWDCQALDRLFSRLASAQGTGSDVGNRVVDLLKGRFPWLRKRRAPDGAATEVAAHQDLGNALFRAMLDRRMVYSCAYWQDAATLDQAQEAKLDLVCRKLYLRHGLRVLDLGCGWGGFARFASERYGVSVVGVTRAKEQATFARHACAGFPVEIRLQDYREVSERFDRIVSLGVLEHAGHKSYTTFARKLTECLEPGGLALTQIIGGDRSSTSGDRWIAARIFPGAAVPSMRELALAFENRLLVEDWHNFGPDYDRTLLAWHANFESMWPTLRGSYSEPFYRAWRYYLLSSAGAFRGRQTQLWQIVLSRQGGYGDYRSVR